MAVEAAHLFVQTIQIQKAVYAPQEMIGRDMRLEIELVEKSGMNLLCSKYSKPSKSP